MKSTPLKFLFGLLFSAFNFISNAQAGFLDSTYGINGIAFVGEDLGGAESIALQNDGKIVSVSSSIIGGDNGFTLSRTNTDGSTDFSFGKEGLVFTPVSGVWAYTQSVKIYNNEKIIALGYRDYQDINGAHFIDLVVIRYNSNGSVDSSFGVNGIATENVGIKSLPTCMAIQPDGKIIVAGTRWDDVNDVQNLFIVRFLSDGTLDNSFANGGVLLEFLSSNIAINDIAIQPKDGKIILGGMYTAANQGAFFLTRYLSDGSRNKGFGIDGEAQILFGTGSSASILKQIALQADGKILAAGRTYNPSSSTKMTIVRFKTNGKADSSFGVNGIVYLKFGENQSEARVLQVDENQKIILAGSVYPANYSFSHFALAKLKNDGSLDSSFGINGQKTDIIINDRGVPEAGVLQKDSRLVLATTDYVSTSGLNLVRYNTVDAVLPITFSQFTATQTKEYITLNWQTATELNNRYFAVERSGNAANYTAIAQVNSAGTGSAVHDYAYTDKLPLRGTNYYRLKQVDADGKYSYSKTVSIAYLKPGAIQLFPNPAKDKLTVKGLNNTLTSTISVLDVEGKTLQQFTAKAATVTFSVNNLPPGSYVVRVKDANGVTTQKFVKQ